MSVKQSTIMAVVLGVLLLVSAVQAVQLTSLKNDITSEDLSFGAKVSAPKSSSGSSGGGSVPSSIQDLPGMVGGC